MLVLDSPKVSIIILNWNGINDTLRLLKNLEQVKYPNMEVPSNFTVLVVDNGSTDDSVLRLKQFIEEHTTAGGYRLSLLPLSQNFGFAEGNNKGIIQATKEKPDYYLLLNNDTIVSQDFLTNLVYPLEEYQQFGAAAPLIYFATPEGKKSDQIWYAGGWLNFFAGGAHHLTSIRPSNQPIVATEFLTGCSLLIRADAVAKIGRLFDPQLFAYGEDLDLSLRLIKQGYQLGFIQKSVIWHKLASSSGGPKSSNFWYYNVRNNFLIMARFAAWYHWPVFILYFIFYKPVMTSVIGAIIRPRKDKPERLKAIAQGTWDAVCGRLGKRK